MAGQVTAIGISKSSSILVRLAIAAPALVKKLVLIGTLIEFWAQHRLARRRARWTSQFRAALTRRPPRASDSRYFVATIVTDPDTGELAEQFTRNLLRLPRESHS